MKNKAVFKWAKLKSIPKVHMFVWICLFLFAFAFLVNLFVPFNENIEDTTITISNAK